MTLPLDSNLAALTLGKLAAELPGASAVLRRHQLDCCADAGLPLDTAAGRAGCDVDAVVAELARLTEPPPAMPAETDALIEWILQRFHATHRSDLAELEQALQRVEAAHGAHPGLPAGLGKLLRTIAANLESHMQREEQVLFPIMQAGGHPMIVNPINMMRLEHDDHTLHIAKLVALTGDFTPPPDACGTWRALYTGLAKLVADLREHIRVENEVLFPRF
ncbi:MAG: DUF542 domain-containing protein [Gammaproteobacteria bacterium]|nr:DUF542 domain-containing protein [Gammaproteobacteria bacterium]MBI5617799.1 DUF542 domain-containing protein [Gammaproteobacteria bacterium]